MHKNPFQNICLLIYGIMAVGSIVINDNLLSTALLMLVNDQFKHHLIDMSSYVNATFINIQFNFTNQNALSATFVMASLTDYYNST
jgi:hypothetical protein